MRSNDGLRVNLFKCARFVLYQCVRCLALCVASILVHFICSVFLGTVALTTHVASYQWMIAMNLVKRISAVKLLGLLPVM